IIGAILQGIPNSAANRRHGDSAAQKNQIPPLPSFHRVTVAIRPAESDYILFFYFPESFRHPANLAKAEFNMIFPVGARADVEGGLAVAERGEDAELPHAKRKTPRPFGIEKTHGHGLHIRRLLADARHFHQIGLVYVIHG